MNIIRNTSIDDKIEIVATFFGSFVVGASFAKDFFMNGNFEIRVFLFGIASSMLFFSIFYFTNIRLKLVDSSMKSISFLWICVFVAGLYLAGNVFVDHFYRNDTQSVGWEAILFLCCFTVSTNLLFLLNKNNLFETLRAKTIYKYLLAPINGIGLGSITMAIIMWMFRGYIHTGN